MIKKFITNEQVNDLVNKYSTPIYLYDKQSIIDNINDLKNLCSIKNYSLNYATKANSNIEILKIMKENNLKVDATGYGEVFINQKAGFDLDKIYVVGNNFTKDELEKISKLNLIISLDSIDQIETLSKVAPNYQKVMLRMNPIFGAGANESVITGGDNHKFAIDYAQLDEAIMMCNNKNMKIIGLNQHIGSAYLEDDSLINGVNAFLKFILNSKLQNLEIIDFGGGFGLNYERNHNNIKMDLNKISEQLTFSFNSFLSKYENKNVSLEFEPGRYLVASSGILIGQVTSLKKRNDQYFVGTDLGFTTLIRPTLYNSYHEVEFITNNTQKQLCSVVGNICESGDYIVKRRQLILPNVGDLVIVYDTGAYGYCLSSNYNNRLRPIEVLKENDSFRVIRKRETLEDLLKNY